LAKNKEVGSARAGVLILLAEDGTSRAVEEEELTGVAKTLF
jgi:hypothetical protein